MKTLQEMKSSDEEINVFFCTSRGHWMEQITIRMKWEKNRPIEEGIEIYGEIIKKNWSMNK